jgi:hypothetical protein
MNQELFLGFTPTAWIAVLTVVLAGATISQALIYAVIHRANKRIERAYISMSHYAPGITFGFDLSVGHEPWKRDVKIKIKICNSGNTPGTVTYALLQPVVAIEPLPREPKYDEAFGEAVNAFVAKGDQVNFTKDFSILTSEVVTIRSLQNNVAEYKRPLRLFIIGYVDYIDRFRVRHRAGYARVYDAWADSRKSLETEMGIVRSSNEVAVISRKELAETHKRRNNLRFVTQPNYNYDREREQDEGNDWDEPAE